MTEKRLTMSYRDSPFSEIYGQDDYEVDDDNEEILDEDRDLDDPDDSDEGKIVYVNIDLVFNFLF